MGVVSAILVCACKTLFLFSHRIVPYSFEANYIYLLFRQSVLPVVILFSVFCAFSKDTIQFKLEAFFPLELSFYAVFLPHLIVSSSEGLYSGFSLFVKPLLYAFMLIQLGIFSRWIGKSIENGKKIFLILFFIGAVIYLCIPSLFEAMYMIKYGLPIMITGIVFYSLIPIALIVLTALKKINI